MDGTAIDRPRWYRAGMIGSIVIAVLMIVGTVGWAPWTTAQEASTAESPFVGAWQVSPTIEGEAAVALTTFHDDGTIITSNRPVQTAPPGLAAEVLVQSLGHGSWSTTSERMADITFMFLQSDPNGTFLGTRTIRGVLELDESGDTWSGDFAIIVADPDGAVVLDTVGTVMATRIGVEPMPEGTPVARST